MYFTATIVVALLIGDMLNTGILKVGTGIALFVILVVLLWMAIQELEELGRETDC